MTVLSDSTTTPAGVGNWASAGNLSVAANWQGPDSGVLLADGTVLVAGGTNAQFQAVATCAVFDPAGGVWGPVGALSQPRQLHSLTRLADGTALAVGGFAPTGPALAGSATVERYDPATRIWASAKSMITPRSNHSATLLTDGRVLVAGGYAVRPGGTNATTAAAEIFDPVAGTWTAAAPMTDARAGHAAVLLHDGRILVVGGSSYVGDRQYAGLGFCEIYDPGSGTWTPTGSMARPRWNNTATVLADGTVFVTGGGWPGMINGWSFNSHSDWTTERFDPATGRWTRDRDMSCARVYHRAVLLHDGRVLVAGGANGAAVQAGFRSTALYDPLAREWAPAGGSSTGRWAPLAVALGDGRVLLAGGVEHIDPAAGPWNLTATSEIFTPPEVLE